jgi:hypothetical protein
MSPLPYVRGQVIMLALLASFVGILGGGVVTLACTAAALAWMLGLRHKYGRDVATAGLDVPAHRAGLDRVVAADAFKWFAPTLLVGLLFLLYPLQPADWLLTAKDIALPLTIAGVFVYASSLFDWYLILPRVSGQLGHRPCRAAEEEESFTFPSTWKEVTRWWYIHRTAGTLAFRLGLIFAAGALASSASDLGLLARLVGWTITFAFGGYAAATVGRGFTLARQTKQAGHVRGIVGQTLQVERRAGRRHPWLLWRELPVLQIDGRHYVVDVALESVQLARAEPREGALDKLPRFQKEVDSLPLSDVDALRQGHPKFSGCANRCSGINWYCIENPRCFDPK